MQYRKRVVVSRKTTLIGFIILCAIFLTRANVLPMQSHDGFIEDQSGIDQDPSNIESCEICEEVQAKADEATSEIPGLEDPASPNQDSVYTDSDIVEASEKVKADPIDIDLNENNEEVT